MKGTWLMTGGSEASANDAKAIRVLVADDHKVMREGLVSLLDGEPNIEVIAEAGDGQEAVELTARWRPDVVVMDVTMPRMTGIEATRHITAQWPQVRVIALSIHRQADMAQAMKDAGARAYLTKDGSLENLIATIRG